MAEVRSERLVEYVAESNVYVTRTVKVPESAMFGWGVSNTEVVECGYCCALVPKERESRHELWHQELDPVAGQ